MMKWNQILPPEAVRKADTLAAQALQVDAVSHDICPRPRQIFRALELTPPEAVRCVIVGQDPYHTPGQANGLAFSVSPGRPLQPSLINIFKELTEDLGIPMPASGDLSPWAGQGVLLLNTSLTTQAGRPGAHAGWGWGYVTGEILKACAALPQPIAFLLWGRHARDAAAGMAVLPGNKCMVCASHPSPFSAMKGSASVPAFMGHRPFSRVNQFLAAKGAQPIDWRLP